MAHHSNLLSYGLQPLEPDSRDFILGRVFELPPLTELPDHYQMDTLGIKHQQGTDFCTAFTTCLISELHEGFELSPEWSFAVSKRISGNVDSWGQDLRSAMKAHVQYGAVPKEDAKNYTIENTDKKELRHIQNYPKSFYTLAEPQRKQSYFIVQGPYDDFDNIRAAMWKFRKQRNAVAIGLVWDWKIDQYRMMKPKTSGFGHAVSVIGWNGDYLLIQNSYGKQAGNNGTHLLHRDVINANVERYGAFMFTDMPQEEAKTNNKAGIKESDGPFIRFIKLLWAILSLK